MLTDNHLYALAFMEELKGVVEKYSQHKPEGFSNIGFDNICESVLKAIPLDTKTAFDVLVAQISERVCNADKESVEKLIRFSRMILSGNSTYVLKQWIE